MLVFIVLYNGNNALVLLESISFSWNSYSTLGIIPPIINTLRPPYVGETYCKLQRIMNRIWM